MFKKFITKILADDTHPIFLLGVSAILAVLFTALIDFLIYGS